MKLMTFDWDWNDHTYGIMTIEKYCFLKPVQSLWNRPWILFSWLKWAFERDKLFFKIIYHWLLMDGDIFSLILEEKMTSAHWFHWLEEDKEVMCNLESHLVDLS